MSMIDPSPGPGKLPGFASEIETGGRDSNPEIVSETVSPQPAHRSSRQMWVGLAIVAAGIVGLLAWSNYSQDDGFVPTPGQGHPHTLILLPVPHSSGVALWLGTHNGLFLKYLSPRAHAGWRNMGGPLNSTDVMALGSGKTPGSPIYAAGHNVGVQRSDDGGTTWRQIMPGAPTRDVHALTVDPQNVERVYIWDEVLGMLASSNGGATWDTLGDGKALTNPVQVTSLAASVATPRGTGVSSLLLYAGTNSGIYISKDAGENWTSAKGEAADQLTYAVLALDRPQTTEVYAGTASGALRSSDGGDTWQRLEATSELGGIGGIAIEESTGAPEKLLVVNSLNDIFASTDEGATWSQLP